MEGQHKRRQKGARLNLQEIAFYYEEEIAGCRLGEQNNLPEIFDACNYISTDVLVNVTRTASTGSRPVY